MRNELVTLILITSFLEPLVALAVSADAQLLSGNLSELEKGNGYVKLARQFGYGDYTANHVDEARKYVQEALKRPIGVKDRIEMYTIWKHLLEFGRMDPKERKEKQNEVILQQLKVVVDNLKIEKNMPLPKYAPAVFDCGGVGCDEARAAFNKKQNEARARYDSASLQNLLLDKKSKYIDWIGKKTADGEIDPTWLQTTSRNILTSEHEDVISEIMRSVESTRTSKPLADQRPTAIRQGGEKNAQFHPEKGD